jgi:hypothetical protein
MALAVFKVTQQLAIRELLDVSSLFRTFMEALFIGRLPQDWRFPSVGVLMLWQTWLLGDTVQNVPPLHMLSANDVAHLDALPLEQGTRRRPARKSDTFRHSLSHELCRVKSLIGWSMDSGAQSNNCDRDLACSRRTLCHTM